MPTGETFTRVHASSSRHHDELKGKVTEAKSALWNRIRNGEFDKVAVKLESELETAEFELYAYEYNASVRR